MTHGLTTGWLAAECRRCGFHFPFLYSEGPIRGMTTVWYTHTYIQTRNTTYLISPVFPPIMQKGLDAMEKCAYASGGEWNTRSLE